MAGCTVAALSAAFGLIPVAGQLLTSGASAASADCSASTSAETELSQAGWSASTNAPSGSNDAPSHAIDGNLSTRYSSDEDQASGVYLEVNLGSAQAFNEVDLQVPNSNGDYARGYNVNVSSNGTSWTTVASCTGTGTPEIASFSNVTDQYVEIVLTASSTTNWWSVDELDLYNGTSSTTTTAATTTTQPTITTTSGGTANCSASASGESQLSRTGWTASTNTKASGGDVASNALDGNLTTRFSSDEAQAPGYYFQAALGSTQSFNEIDMEVPNSNGDYARAFTVGVSTNGSTFTTVATCTGTSASEVVSFGTQSASYVRVTLTGAGGTTNWWSIDEFYVDAAGGTTTTTGATTTTAGGSGGTPNFGPNVYIFTPSTPTSTIQTDLNNTYNSQASNQFGTQRYAFLFTPGTYGVSANIGYYTSIMGLGQNPDNVVINGTVDTDAQWNGGNATLNFWRSASNMEVNVPSGGQDVWAPAQAGPFRRMDVHGNLLVAPSQEGWSSGGYIADTRVTGSVSSGSEQQWFSRNSQFGSWTGSNWNMVFSGVQGAPAQSFPNPPYTTLATTPVTREEPYLYVDSSGNYHVFVPSVQTNSSGTTWASGNTPGTSLPISSFFIAQPSDTTAQIQSALTAGDNLLFTPGIYNITQTLQVTKADTVVMGIGFPTLIPQGGVNTMSVADVPGVNVSSILFDAGPQNSAALLTMGVQGSTANNASDPDTIDDDFFRIGGDQAGMATTSLIDNANNSIIDDIWAWRADHGNGVGWTVNKAANGLVVNGNNVDAYGLFVEHYQQYEIIWNGNGGEDIFLQNENPYDPPSQSAWMATSTQDGYPALYVSPNVTTFQGYGLGSYCNFTAATVYNAMAFQAPAVSGVQFHDLVTIYLSSNGGINSVINGTGAAVNSSNGKSDVVSYS